MLKITLGEMLKRFRIEKGVEAGQVCSGLCSKGLMSHFETGRKVPDTLLFEYMMERMGVSSELFSVMVSKEEYEYYGWKEQVFDAIAVRDITKLEELLVSKIAKTKYCNSKIEQQFLLYAKAICCGMNKKYSEASEMLEKAVEQTIPNIYEIGNSKMLLSAMELHILMLYLYYGVLGGVLDVHRGKELFYGLEEYVDSENLELILRAKIYPKLCCVGIQLFEQIMTKNEQLELCEKSVELMVQDMYVIDPQSTETIKANVNYNDDSGEGLNPLIKVDLTANVPYLIIYSAYNPNSLTETQTLSVEICKN